MDRSRPRIVLVNRCVIVNDEGRILLVQRSAKDSNNAGLWEVPGGKLDEGQDLTHALEREVLEETGLLIDPAPELFTVESRIIGDGKYKGMPYVSLFFSSAIRGGKLKLSEEHDDHCWVTYKEALEFELAPETHKALIVFAQR